MLADANFRTQEEVKRPFGQVLGPMHLSDEHAKRVTAHVLFVRVYFILSLLILFHMAILFCRQFPLLWYSPA